MITQDFDYFDERPLKKGVSVNRQKPEDRFKMKSPIRRKIFSESTENN